MVGQEITGSLYDLLGVSRDVSADLLKKTYRAAALKLHPDKNKGSADASEQFQRVSHAYNILSDPVKRRFYDETGTTEDCDVPIEEFMHDFCALIEEDFGGLHQIQAVLVGMTKDELAEIPPFPFPKELFPPGSFPASLRFSSEAFQGRLPPAVTALLETGDPEGLLAALYLQAAQRGAELRQELEGEADGDDLLAEEYTKQGLPWNAQHQHSSTFRTKRGKQPSLNSGYSPAAAMFGLPDVPHELLQVLMRELGDELELPADLQHVDQDMLLELQGLLRGESRVPLRGKKPKARRRKLGRKKPTSSSSAAFPLPGEGPAEEQPPAPAREAGPPQLGRQWIQAAKDGELDAMRALLGSDPSLLSFQGPGIGHTALHWCAAKGHADALQWLLCAGADANCRNACGSMPLHSAAAHGQAECTRLLLDHGAEASQRDEDGATPRELALGRKWLEVASIIEAWTARQSATPATTPDALEAVGPARWAAPSDGDASASRALATSKESSAASKVEVLDDAEPQYSGACELMPEGVMQQAALAQPSGREGESVVAQRDGDGSGGRDLGLDDRMDNLQLSAESAGHTECSVHGKLAEHTERETADAWMHTSSSRGGVGCSDMACSSAMDKAQGRRWLDAARAGRLRDLKTEMALNPALLQYGGQGTSYAVMGHTALHWCAANGHAEPLQWLLERGADPRQRNNAGGMPLHAAAGHGHERCTALLLRLGPRADAGAVDASGDTARDAALARGHHDCVRQIDLAQKATMLQEQPQGAWRAADMRALLRLAQRDCAGALERAELCGMCQAVIRELGIPSTTGADSARHGDAGCSTGAPFDGTGEAVGRSGGQRGPCCEVELHGSGDVRDPECPSSSPATSMELRRRWPAGSSDRPKEIRAGDEGQAAGLEDDRKAEDAARLAQLVEAAKQAGNQAFKSRDFKGAAAKYSLALNLDSQNAVLHSNRSAANAGLGRWDAALEDALAALKLQPGWARAHVRHGAALLGLGQAGEAVKAYRAALKLEPGNTGATSGLQSAEAAIGELERRYTEMWGK